MLSPLDGWVRVVAIVVLGTPRWLVISRTLFATGDGLGAFSNTKEE